MLNIKIDGKNVVNPNEKFRIQFNEILENYKDEEDDEIYSEIYDIINSLKEINYNQYRMVVTLIYKDVYSYFRYMNKTNETNKVFKYKLCNLSATSTKQVIEIYETNTDILIENFVYLLSLSNLYRAKLLLELSDIQNEHLLKISPLHMYDLLALQDYVGYKILEDYYLKNIDDELEIDEENVYEQIPEELIEDIINFLDYLYFQHKDIYKKCIKEIIEKIYKWCYYYFENSIEVETNDLEIRIIELVNGSSIDEICEKIKQDKNLLSEILLRIFDDLDMGYPMITTTSGDEIITETDLNEYMVKIKRKQF